jgi:hypothetical protein
VKQSYLLEVSHHFPTVQKLDDEMKQAARVAAHQVSCMQLTPYNNNVLCFSLLQTMD